MKINDAQGKPWILSRCLPGHEPEIHDWILALGRSRWLYPLKTLDSEGNIDEARMENIIEWLNLLTEIALGAKDGWVEKRRQTIQMQIDLDCLAEDMTATGFCKDTLAEVVRLANQVRRDHLPPMLPEDLVRYVVFKKVEQMCNDRGASMPTKVSAELTRLQVDWQANEDASWVADCIDETYQYLALLPAPLFSPVFLGLPQKIPGVAIQPFKVLTAVYGGAGERRKNKDVARIFSVMGLVTKNPPKEGHRNSTNSLLTPGNIDRTVSPVHVKLRSLVESSFLNFIDQLDPNALSLIETLMESFRCKLLENISESDDTTLGLLCDEYVPEKKVRLFGKPVRLLADEMKKHLPKNLAHAEEGAVV